MAGILQWLSFSSKKRCQEAEANVLKLVDPSVEIKHHHFSGMNSIECATPESRIPLILAHGFGAGLGFWFKNIGPLCRQGYRVYAIDWLGMGMSTRPEWTATNSEEAVTFFLNAFDGWREEMGLDSFVLAGHSLGGYLSTQYALRHPHRIRHLLLVSPVGIPPSPPDFDFSKRPLIYKAVGQLWDWNVTPQGVIKTLGPLGPGLIKKFASKRFGSDVLSEEQIDHLQKYMYEYFRLPGCGEYALNTILKPGAFAREPLAERLADLQPRTTFFYGDKDWMDPTIPKQVAPSMRCGAEVVIVPSSGHHLYMDNPDFFHERIRQATAHVLG